MKIGVLTFCSTEDNYGQVLQCYALQFYLNSMGHETYLTLIPQHFDLTLFISS